MTNSNKSLIGGITVIGALVAGAVALAQDAAAPATPAAPAAQQDDDGATPKGALKLRKPKADGDAKALPALPKLNPMREGTQFGSEEWNREFERWNSEMSQWQSQVDQILKEMMADPSHAFGSLNLPGNVPGRVFQFTPGAPGQSRGTMSLQTSRDDEQGRSRFELSVGEDGKVTGKVVRDKDGDHTERSFEADSIEAFKRDHADLVQEFGLQIGDGFSGVFTVPNGQTGPNGSWNGFGNNGRAFRRFTVPSPQLPRFRTAPNAQGAPRAQNDPNVPQWRGFQSGSPFDRAVVAEGPRLGVQARALEASDPLRHQLDLEAGVGLLVVEVVPGSLAEELGVQVNDIVVRIGDKKIGSADDVHAALADDEHVAVTVTVLRGGKERTLRSGI